MSLKIRLQRQGKKKQPFYHIVVADSRSARDGKYVERLGTYNPKHDHEGVTLNDIKTVEWLEKGALPTDSCRTILSERGILYRKHLNRGVKKGVLTQEQADANYAKWIGEKTTVQSAEKAKKTSALKELRQQRLTAEQAVKDAKAKLVTEKKAAAEAAKQPAVENPTEVEAPKAESAPESTTPTPQA